jgi:mono/diheme cytochrome c family protein
MTLVLAVEAFRAIGVTVAVLTLVVFLVLWYRNVRQSRAELGAEVEVAPNRRAYLSDEELEGVKLDRSLSFALVLLAIVGVGLPLYWLAEPGRQDGAVDHFQAQFDSRGQNLYNDGAQCAACHGPGGVGGVAAYVLQDANGQFVASAAWQSPALDTVLHRYTRSEVRYVLNFGRPGSPMAAWGTPGGGPLTEQQVDNIIDYLETVQRQSLDPIAIGEADDVEAAAAAAQEVADTVRAEVERSLDAGEFESLGEAVFNLGFFSGFQGGALSCARCHSAGWSLGPELAADALDDGIAGCGGGDPSGIGFNLCDGSTLRRFPDDAWKLPDGSWYPIDGIVNDAGEQVVLAQDGTEIVLDERGTPVTDAGDPYAILPDGDLLDITTCDFVSALSAFGEPIEPGADPEAEDVPVLEPQEGDTVLAEGRVVRDCDDPVEMPERTSQSHFDFIFNGAEAGRGYGRGGQSTAGQMPAFGGVLPLEYIQAVIDYERGL